MAIPERTCVGCGEKQPATVLVRLRLVEGGVAVDEERRGGRGAWVHAGGACLARAVKRKGFARAFRAPVAVDESRLREQLTGNGGRV
jgi:predicted RNA-binding protein YlxR (DUF448 family)